MPACWNRGSHCADCRDEDDARPPNKRAARRPVRWLCPQYSRHSMGTWLAMPQRLQQVKQPEMWRPLTVAAAREKCREREHWRPAKPPEMPQPWMATVQREKRR